AEAAQVVGAVSPAALARGDSDPARAGPDLRRHIAARLRERRRAAPDAARDDHRPQPRLPLGPPPEHGPYVPRRVAAPGLPSHGPPPAAVRPLVILSALWLVARRISAIAVARRLSYRLERKNSANCGENAAGSGSRDGSLRRHSATASAACCRSRASFSPPGRKRAKWAAAFNSDTWAAERPLSPASGSSRWTDSS